MANNKAKAIKLIVSDVDGVMTDGGLYYGKNGEETKKFNVKDGLVINALKKNGIKLCIITGRESEIVKRRFSELQFDFIIQGSDNKLRDLQKVVEKVRIDVESVAYIGDDTNDLELLRSVGFSACPNDAVSVLKSEVNYVCQKNGGEGAFREFADYILAHHTPPFS